MTALLRQLDAFRRSPVAGQLVRFAVAGVIASLIYSAVYLPLSLYVLPRRLAALAVPPAFLVAVTCGFFLHSAWSFRGHGTRENSGRQHFKFFVVQLCGMLLNASYAWVLSGMMGMPPWVPLIPAVLVTPFITFGINRSWVFG